MKGSRCILVAREEAQIQTLKHSFNRRDTTSDPKGEEMRKRQMETETERVSRKGIGSKNCGN